MSEAYPEQEVPQESVIDMLVREDNVVSMVKDEELARIGARVVEETDIDLKSMSGWMKRNEVARNLIDSKLERKTEPWDGAANTKLPLVLNAAQRVSAEEYSEILRGNQLVKTEMYGKGDDAKKKRADRVAKRMNFQYQHEFEDWEDDHDKLILAKNIFGTVHKKYLWCKAKDRIECVLRRNGVVINDSVEHLADAPRITDELDFYWWECEEKFRSGEWAKMELTAEQTSEFAQSDKVNTFLEQLRREDLDGDGYPEPYIVTVHKKTKKVVAIVPNYTPESIIKGEDGSVVRIDLSRTRVRYVKYEMLPSFDGGYWGPGFGILLSPLNDNCNALVNQLLDAGTLANNGGGFFSSAIRMGQGSLKFKMGEWKPVNAPGIDFRNSFFEKPVREPSSTLFNLLGLLMDVLRELSSVTEVMSGDQPHANMAQGTIQSLIEQGKKVFNSIYKRHYSSLRKEFVALFDLNFLYEDPAAYLKFHDLKPEILMQEMPGTSLQEIALAVVQGDFERVELDVFPTANPEFSTRLQRLGQAQALLQVGGPGAPPPPWLNAALAGRMFAEAVVDDADLAAQLVPEEPLKTPMQVMQEMEVMKQEILDSAEVRLAQSKEQIADLERQIKELELAKVQAEAPAKAEAASHKSDQAELGAIQSALAIDELQKKIELLDVDKQLKEADTKLKEADAELKQAEAAALKKESERSSTSSGE